MNTNPIFTPSDFVVETREVTRRILASIKGNEQSTKAWEKAAIEQFQDQQYMQQLIAEKYQ